MKRKLYNREELDKIKTDLIDYQSFKYMDREQQAKLLSFWEKQFSIKDLSKFWGVNSSAVYSLKTTLRKMGLNVGEDKAKKKPIKNRKEVSQEQEKLEILDVSADQTNVPLEYVSQFIEEPIRVYKEEQVRVSLDEFMKLLEIQEKMAKMMEDQTKQNHEGLHFHFNGVFSSEQLTKRLQKILSIIEDEPMKYKIKFELYELEEDSSTEKEKVKNELLEEVTTLQGTMRDMQKQMENQSVLNWKAGYQALATDKKGLHIIRSEYEKNGEFSGVAHRDGKKLYQTFYICDKCGSKGKLFLENGTVFANCGNCGHRMRIRDAVKEEHLKQDDFGNFFIAGRFKRENEFDRH